MTAVWSLTELEVVFRLCWDERTCDPSDTWDAANPAGGHCGVTAMAVAELLGGEESGPVSEHEPIRCPTARMATRYDLFASRVRARLGGSVPAGIPA
ncbi:hypothetical protein [Amycolatopsis sp. WQ 127309]|uniref:YunG family protein n=1 Tax=Amycolatopsis sp. WQ 127309 TaxID=2932773 RepID=UPI001FF546D8|nr:hypothetical protein [Amycolatopsis sp. WQ 127309]UOZ05068.1 hypothetical protein MUY22_40570 [Amycolatopsis sp. WQ 127309]